MDRAGLQEFADRLAATGLYFARLERDPTYTGVRHIWEPVPWDQVIVRLANATGWTLVGERAKAPEDPAQLRLVE